MVTIPKISQNDKSINWIGDKSVLCSRLEIPLFNTEHPNKVHFTDVIQGEIGSCWFLSVLISYLRPNSKNIEQRSLDIYNSIRVYREDTNRTVYIVKLNNKKVIVDDYVPKTYHIDYNKKCAVKCKWFILFEKAMLSLMTFYKNGSKGSERSEGSPDMIYVSNIDIKCGEMKAATIGIGYMIPGKTKYYCLHKKDITSYLPQIEAQELYVRFKSGNHIMANTSRWTYPCAKYPFNGGVASAGGIPTHCYAVINIEYSKEQKTYLLTIQNPWGNREIAESGSNFVYPEGVSRGKGLSIITWERFWHLFACVHLTE